MKKSNRGFDMDNEYKNQDEEQENSLETSNQAELNDEEAVEKYIKETERLIRK